MLNLSSHIRVLAIIINHFGQVPIPSSLDELKHLIRKTDFPIFLTIRQNKLKSHFDLTENFKYCELIIKVTLGLNILEGKDYILCK